MSSRLSTNIASDNISITTTITLSS